MKENFYLTSIFFEEKEITIEYAPLLSHLHDAFLSNPVLRSQWRQAGWSLSVPISTLDCRDVISSILYWGWHQLATQRPSALGLAISDLGCLFLGLAPVLPETFSKLLKFPDIISASPERSSKVLVYARKFQQPPTTLLWLEVFWCTFIAHMLHLWM